MKQEKGFTLIELLAVIIILAIIALISIPLVLNIIEKTRKSAFEDTAYGIMESAKLYYIENIIDNKELGDKVFSYEEEEKELKYSGTRPEGGTVIVKSNGKIEMSIHNNKWCAVKSEEDSKVKILDYNEETCKISGIVEPSKPTLKGPEEILKEEAVGENGIVVTDTDGNRRFAGSNPNNWVCFGDSNMTDPASCDENHKWRIIGIDTSGRMKIMTNYYYSTGKAWDTSNSNNWGRPATLNTELNGASFYSNNTYIDETHREYIMNAIWYTGANATTAYDLQSFIDGEKSTSATGYVGLMSMVDFGYAGSECISTIVMTNQNNVCMSNNWIGYSNYQRSITPHSGNSAAVWYVNTDGFASWGGANSPNGVRPVVYLDSSVKITAGSGTESNPYILKKE